jgi:membrane protein
VQVSEENPGTRRSPQQAKTEVPGGDAGSPAQIPARGWWQVTKRAWAEAKADQVPLMAAGVAFFGFLSLFPAMIAAVLTYGLVASPSQMRSQVQQLSGAIPPSARSLLTKQLDSVTSSPQQSLGIGLVISLLAALWSASGGVGYLMTAVNIAYDETDNRGWIKRKLLALALTLGAIVFMVLAIALVAVAPAVFGSLGASTLATIGLQILRWLLIIVLVSVALAVVYRVAPDRDAPAMKWVSTGAVIATVLWLVASVGFSLYTSFGSYGKSYGSLAGVAVLLLWLWITSYAVLLGAEINAESEEQTVRDTTKGPEKPLGERGAVKADSLPPR